MRRLAPSTAPLAALFDSAPNLFWDPAADPPEPAKAPIPARIIEMPAPPAPAPKQTLRAHISGVEDLMDALDRLDSEDLDDERKRELGDDVIEALAGTRAKVDDVNRALVIFAGIEASAEREIERLAQRMARYARQRERLTRYVIEVMQSFGIPKLEGETVTFTVRANPPKVEIEDPARIPDILKRFKPAPPAEPNKTAIAAELKAGREVPGARLVQTQRLERK